MKPSRKAAVFILIGLVALVDCRIPSIPLRSPKFVRFADEIAQYSIRTLPDIDISNALKSEFSANLALRSETAEQLFILEFQISKFLKLCGIDQSVALIQVVPQAYTIKSFTNVLLNQLEPTVQVEWSRSARRLADDLVDLNRLVMKGSKYMLPTKVHVFAAVNWAFVDIDTAKDREMVNARAYEILTQMDKGEAVMPLTGSMRIVMHRIFENRVSWLLPVVQCIVKAALGQSLDNDTFLAMVDLAEAAVDVVPSDTENSGLRVATGEHMPYLFHAAKWNHRPEVDAIVGIKIREFSQRIFNYSTIISMLSQIGATIERTTMQF